MKKALLIGADVGGTHISCACAELHTLELSSSCTVKLDSNAGKKEVFKAWAAPINNVVQDLEAEGAEINIGFAMPGPFDYKNGIALFDASVGKYQELYLANIANELPAHLVKGNYTFRFINDAAAFAVGAVNHMKLNNQQRILTLTLGTGLGACFLEKGVPLFKDATIPENGWLYNQKFKEGIADEYFSTRWFTKQFLQRTGKKVSGVRELIVSNDGVTTDIFEEFVENLQVFLTPYIRTFKPNTILLGGNIAKASDYFLADLNTSLAKFNLEVVMSTIGEEAAIIGSAQLFEPNFWGKIKNDL